MALLRSIRRGREGREFSVDENVEEQFTFFWRGPFSNWHPSDFELDGVRYRCNEQFMMAEKARLFGDARIERAIMQAAEPSEHKALGRRVKGFDQEVWSREAKGIVLKGAVAKFAQNDALLESICRTDGTTIVEASPYDRIWGIGLSARDPRALSRDTWLGLNWLGEVLTVARDRHLLPLHVNRHGTDSPARPL